MPDLAADELALVDVIVPQHQNERSIQWSSAAAFEAADVDTSGGLAYHATDDTVFAVPVPERGAGKADATTRAIRGRRVTLPPAYAAAVDLDIETVVAAHDQGETGDIRLAVYARPGVLAFRAAPSVDVPAATQAELEALADRSLFA